MTSAKDARQALLSMTATDDGGVLAGAAARSVRPAALLGAHPLDSAGKAVAVVTVAGPIVDGKAGPGTAGGDRIAALIDDANADDASALVLRVDSPGGSVLASEAIRAALERFKAKGRPVAVSMANMAASGGYWVSTPGQRIFAEPATITGSIGIFAVLPSFEKALAHYGIKADGVRTTALSGQPDVLAGFSPEVEKMLQADIDNGYARFIGLVGKARGKSAEQVDAIAQGRAWDGGTARQNGLVDQFGGLPDALDWVAKQAKLESWHAQYYGKDADPFGSLLERLGNGDEDSENQGTARDFAGLVALRQQQGLIHAWNALARLGEVQGAQAYCMDCPVEEAALAPAKRVSSPSASPISSATAPAPIAFSPLPSLAKRPAKCRNVPRHFLQRSIPLKREGQHSGARHRIEQVPHDGLNTEKLKGLWEEGGHKAR